MKDEKPPIPVTQLLRAEFSFFRSIKSKSAKPLKTTLEKFLEHQGERPRWRPKVEAVRQSQGGAMVLGGHFSKDNLPAAKPSGCFKDLSDKSLVSHSGILCIDLDVDANPGLATNDGATAIRDRLRRDPHVIAFYASTGGKGLAVYVPVSGGVNVAKNGRFENRRAMS